MLATIVTCVTVIILATIIAVTYVYTADPEQFNDVIATLKREEVSESSSVDDTPADDSDELESEISRLFMTSASKPKKNCHEMYCENLLDSISISMETGDRFIDDDEMGTALGAYAEAHDFLYVAHDQCMDEYLDRADELQEDVDTMMDALVPEAIDGAEYHHRAFQKTLKLDGKKLLRKIAFEEGADCDNSEY